MSLFHLIVAHYALFVPWGLPSPQLLGSVVLDLTVRAKMAAADRRMAASAKETHDMRLRHAKLDRDKQLRNARFDAMEAQIEAWRQYNVLRARADAVGKVVAAVGDTCGLSPVRSAVGPPLAARLPTLVAKPFTPAELGTMMRQFESNVQKLQQERVLPPGPPRP